VNLFDESRLSFFFSSHVAYLFRRVKNSVLKTWQRRRCSISPVWETEEATARIFLLRKGTYNKPRSWINANSPARPERLRPKNRAVKSIRLVPAARPHQSSRWESKGGKALIGRIFQHRPSETRLEIIAVLAEILKKRKTTRGDLRGYSWRNGAARAMPLFYFFSLSLCLAIRFSVSFSVSFLVAPTLAFCTAERRIGSLNKMTRLFIGAFVRVKVGITLLFGRRPWISLCDHFGWFGVSESGALRLIGCRKRLVYFLFAHFRARSSFDPVTLANARIRGVYEVMSKPPLAMTKIAMRGSVSLFVCLIIIVIRWKCRNGRKGRE